MCTQLPLFENERRCRGGSCVRVLPDGRYECMHCGRIFKSYREGYRNCGVTDTAFWDAMNNQVEPNPDETYTIPEDGVVIRKPTKASS